jgi:antitoxin YefM
MDAIAYTTQNLTETFDRVCDDHEVMIMTREAQQSVVSLADDNALEETAFLLRSPQNAQRLLGSIAELEAGLGTERELLD